jgi:hypothetical protein
MHVYYASQPIATGLSLVTSMDNDGDKDCGVVWLTLKTLRTHAQRKRQIKSFEYLPKDTDRRARSP